MFFWSLDWVWSWSMWDQYMSHMSASSSVCWYCIGNAVPCHTLTFLSFIQIYVTSETCNLALMLTQWTGLSCQLDDVVVVLESLTLSGVAAEIEPVTSSIRDCTHMRIVRTRIWLPVCPSACRRAWVPWTFRISPASLSSFCPSSVSLYAQAFEAFWLVSTVVGRTFCL